MDNLGLIGFCFLSASCRQSGILTLRKGESEFNLVFDVISVHHRNQFCFSQLGGLQSFPGHRLGGRSECGAGINNIVRNYLMNFTLKITVFKAVYKLNKKIIFRRKK